MSFVDDLIKQLTACAHEARLLRELRAMCGYVQDGSHQAVTVGQDEATGYWYVRVGEQSFSAPSFPAAITQAARALGVHEKNSV